MKSVMRLRQQKYHSGFTLVELMVSLTVFSIVMLVSVGTLLVMVDANAKAQAIYSATTNLSFALDSMSRDIRTGYHYYCDQGTTAMLTTGFNIRDASLVNSGNQRGCTDGRIIKFTREIDGLDVGYRYNTVDKTIEYSDSNQLGTWIRLTAPAEVLIEEFKLFVDESEPYGRYESGNFTTSGLGNVGQPNIDLFVSGAVANNNGLSTATDFSVQTHITQRRLDVD